MAERIKSGIQGFDKVIDGGFVKNAAVLLSGGPGTGKSIFSMQFLLNGVRQHKQKGIYFSFEQTEEDLKKDIESLDMNFKNLGGKLKIIYTPLDEIDNFISKISDEVESFKPARVVVDSLSVLALPMEDDYERKKYIFEIIDYLKKMGCTTIFTSEIPSDSASNTESVGTFSRFGIEEFLCDSVIILHYAGFGGESDRAVRVVKMRRTNHLKGPMPLKIGKGGMKVMKSKFLG